MSTIIICKQNYCTNLANLYNSRQEMSVKLLNFGKYASCIQFYAVKIKVKQEDNYGKNGLNICKRRDGRRESRYKNCFKPDGMPHYTYVYGTTYGNVKIMTLKFIKKF